MPQERLDGNETTAYYDQVCLDYATDRAVSVRPWISEILRSDLHPIGGDRYDPSLIDCGEKGEQSDKSNDTRDSSSEILVVSITYCTWTTSLQ